MTCFIHADLDAFYASVEQLDHPEYRGKPVIVGGLPADRRSVVSTASYEARKYGVHSGMPTAVAFNLCPNGVFLRTNMERYKEKSKEVMEVFTNWTPTVQKISIDEAFLDITGTEKLFGNPESLALKLKKEVTEKTGLTVSIGIASNKYVAKIASGISKPDGLFIVPPGGEEQFMITLPCKKIWGAGNKSQERFAEFGFKTCKDIHDKTLSELISLFGNSFGLFLYRAVRGEAAVAFGEERSSHSISAERTFSYDLFDKIMIETALLELSHTLFFRLLENKLESKTVCIKIRYSDFATESAQASAALPVASVNDLYNRLLNLFYKKYKENKGIRLLGAALFNLQSEGENQQELFESGFEKNKKLEKCILEINKKYPNAQVKKARLLNSGQSC